MEWIKNNIVSLLLLAGIIFIIFIGNNDINDLRELNKDILDRYEQELIKRDEKILKDSIRYSKKIDSISNVISYYIWQKNKLAKDYENEKEQFKTITSDSNFVYINDSIERLLRSSPR